MVRRMADVTMTRRMFQKSCCRNVYLKPFHAAGEAGAGGFMSAYMDLNDVPASGNHWLLTDVLRKDWGFQGIVLSDAFAGCGAQASRTRAAIAQPRGALDATAPFPLGGRLPRQSEDGCSRLQTLPSHVIRETHRSCAGLYCLHRFTSQASQYLQYRSHSGRSLSLQAPGHCLQ
jgi:hypothetical protein